MNFSLDLYSSELLNVSLEKNFFSVECLEVGWYWLRFSWNLIDSNVSLHLLFAVDFKWMVLRPLMNRGTGTTTPLVAWDSSLSWICKYVFSVSIALHESWLERVWNVAKNCLAQPKRWFNLYCQSQTTFNDYRKGIPSAVFDENLSSDNKRYHQARWSLLIFTVDILFEKVKM